MSIIPITALGRVRRFLEIRDANYRNRSNVIETVFEFVGPDPVEHKLTMHDLEALMTERNALAAAVASAVYSLQNVPRSQVPMDVSSALYELERVNAKAAV